MADNEEEIDDHNKRANFWLVRQCWERQPPKFIRNPYIYFCQANYGRFARILNTRMPQCVIRALGQAWRGLDDQSKKPYVKMFLEDQDRYRTVRGEWERAYIGRPPKYRKRNKYAPTFTSFVPPKRYRTAYIWFHAYMRSKVKARFPEWDGGEQVREIADLWKELNVDEKKPFQSMANRDMKRYVTEMRQFRRATFHQEANKRVRNVEVRLANMRQKYMQKERVKKERQQQRRDGGGN